jgi:hypothetical protein
MDSARRRDLKKIGKQLVHERSEEVRGRLAARNPWPVGHPNWVSNLQAEYQLNRKYRKNTLQVLNEASVRSDAEIKFLGLDFEDGFIPHKGWYVLCHVCRELVPTACSYTMGCRCSAVAISPESKQVRLPSLDKYSVIELVGRGPIGING